MKKRVISLVLVVVFAVLMGCSSNSGNSSSSGTTVPATKETAAPETPATSSQSAAPSTASNESSKPVPPKGFPSGTITVIVPQSAGGGTDTGVRLLMKYAQDYFKVPLVVNNMPGGSTVVGVTEAMNYDTDGLTLIQFATASIIAFEVGGQFDITKDFEYVSLQVSDPRVLVFRKDDKRFSTREEFIQYVKDHPGELTLAVTGLNNASHISAEVFKKKTGLDMEIVNFDGQATMKPALLGGDIDAAWQSVGESTPMMAENQITCVAVCAEERYEKDLPGVPTAKELGFDVVACSYRGYAYKKGVSKEIADYMAAVFEDISKDPDYIKEMSNLGLPNTFKGPKDYAALCLEEKASYSEVLKGLGLIK